MSFFEHGLVLSHHLKQNKGPFTPVMRDLQKGRNDYIPPDRQLLVERHLMKLFKTQREMFYRIFAVERMSWFFAKDLEALDPVSYLHRKQTKHQDKLQICTHAQMLYPMRKTGTT